MKWRSDKGDRGKGREKDKVLFEDNDPVCPVVISVIILGKLSLKYLLLWPLKNSITAHSFGLGTESSY